MEHSESGGQKHSGSTLRALFSQGTRLPCEWLVFFLYWPSAIAIIFVTDLKDSDVRQRPGCSSNQCLPKKDLLCNFRFFFSAGGGVLTFLFLPSIYLPANTYILGHSLCHLHREGPKTSDNIM